MRIEMVRRKCSVHQCRSIYGQGMFLFSLPTVEEIRVEWLNFIVSSGNKVLENVKICQEHFLPSEIIVYQSMRRLKQGAVPSILADVTVNHNKKSTTFCRNSHSSCDEIESDSCFPLRRMSASDNLLEETEAPQSSPPALKFVNIFNELKEEKPVKSAMNFITVKTPSQLNGALSRASPTRSVAVRSSLHHPVTLTPVRSPTIVKRLGNTTIRSTGGTRTISEALNNQMKQYVTASNQQKNQPMQLLRPRLMQPTPTILSPPKPVVVDQRDWYIKHLQSQHTEMKNILLECRREAASVQMKMRKLTLTINEVLNRVQNGKVPPMPVRLPPQPTPRMAPVVVDMPPIPPMNITVGKKGTMKHQGPFRLPVFPIRSLKVFRGFDMDLSNQHYHQHVLQNRVGACTKVKIEKPSGMLTFVLRALVTEELLAMFSTEYANFHKFHGNFRAFYDRLVNSVSKLMYGKNMDPRAVEQFLKQKILAQSRNVVRAIPKVITVARPVREETPESERVQPLQEQPESSAEKIETAIEKADNTESNQEKEEDKEISIQWIADDGAADDDNNEMENSISGEGEHSNEDDDDPMQGDESHGDNQESEGHDEDEDEEGNDDDRHPESIVEEQDFEFLDC